MAAEIEEVFMSDPRFLKLPADELLALLLAFQKAGMTIEQAREVIHNPRIAKSMVDTLVRALSSDDGKQPRASIEKPTEPAPNKPTDKVETVRPLGVSHSTSAWR
jgi:hypothetical protein